MAKILVVDDEPSIAALLKTILVAKGYEVVVCLDSTEAEDLILAKKPDLAIIDYSMPGKTGTQLLADLRAREQTRRLPVIFLSTMETLRYSSKAPPEPRVHFLRKPVDASVLLVLIAEKLNPEGWSAAA